MGDLEKFKSDLMSANDFFSKIEFFNFYSLDLRFANQLGDEFQFGIYDGPLEYKRRRYKLSVWDRSGRTSVFSKLIPEDLKDRENFISNLFDITKDYTNGIIHCSDCDEIAKYTDVYKHKYFTGIYCDNCWNSKWKAIEAKENYN